LACLKGTPIVLQAGGDQKLDMIYVQDAAKWLASLVDCDSDELAGQAVNLGTGSSISIRDIALACVSLTGNKVPIEQGPARRWYFKESCASTYRMKQLSPIQFTPFYTALDETERFYHQFAL